MNTHYTSHLLSENQTAECQLAIIERKHSLGYVDEQNWQMVPAEWFEAGGEV